MSGRPGSDIDKKGPLDASSVAEASDAYHNAVATGSSTNPRKSRFSLRVEQQPSSFAPSAKLSNMDFDPTPPFARTWTAFSFVCYWASDAWAVSILELGSSIATVTLSWRLSIVSIMVGFLIMGVVVTLNSNPGARYHIPFPIIARSSFAYNLSYYTVFSRAVLAIFWLGRSPRPPGAQT